MIQAVILDWAGTMVDYGCFAPVAAFMKVFEERGIGVTQEEVRKPMGMLKKDHLRAICEMDRVAVLWQAQYGRTPNEADVDSLYGDFEPMLFSILHRYAEPIPGAVDMAERLRKQGIRIGTTTGYTREMMNVVAPEAAKRGYEPDGIVCPDEAAGGRPLPWMLYQNAIRLGVYPMKHLVKCGDTISDMMEGANAGVWTVGVLKGGSELGMTEQEVEACDPEELSRRLDQIESGFRAAGAHYVIETIGELDRVVAQINERLAKGERP
ncbi:phosphonoacetaldehyde hydrolase [Paenibacillus doosanensis]|uniref:Phosphonoacetaldehyde hydrolase n=1 Tax=Paenibacillus konkukensis TaxID=2020716 RepID=A0ABY4RVB3_9BACL|nr:MULTISPECIES: phosphonoacetaldehyde hydrolase [Paenibacillus]MCS7460962.1 phosphonoacetaldehyde hydrolase [Paenibacillus doosanensis]UQZ85631.1 Phosphonoacetaldehyde hydrolase [Paenibacillus konkukensis]